MYHDLARELRKNLTDAERRLWSHLRGKQFGGFRFRRQAPIGEFIVDFACFERRVVVELDGGQHRAISEEDEARTAWLNSQGFRVLRFWNHEVFEDIDSILEAIWQALKTPAGQEVSHWETPDAERGIRRTPHPDPPPQGGRGLPGELPPQGGGDLKDNRLRQNQRRTRRRVTREDPELLKS